MFFLKCSQMYKTMEVQSGSARPIKYSSIEMHKVGIIGISANFLLCCAMLQQWMFNSYSTMK